MLAAPIEGESLVSQSHQSHSQSGVVPGPSVSAAVDVVICQTARLIFKATSIAKTPYFDVDHREDVPPAGGLVSRARPIGIALLGLFPPERPRTRPSAPSTTCAARYISTCSFFVTPPDSDRLEGELRYIDVITCSELGLCCSVWTLLRSVRKLVSFTFARAPRSRKICRFNSRRKQILKTRIKHNKYREC